VGINPDNVATPIAASLGDLITLSLLAGISTGLYKELGTRAHTHAHTHRRTLEITELNRTHSTCLRYRHTQTHLSLTYTHLTNTHSALYLSVSPQGVSVAEYLNGLFRQ
jgi:hypothetical protein